MPDEPTASPLDELHGLKYEVGDEVARGAFGAVYAARDCRLHRTVALKTLLDDGGGAGQNRRRFVLEARVLGQLQHPNIVPIHDLGLDESGRAFYTMKFVKGATLRDVLHRLRDGNQVAIRDYPLTRLLAVFQKICDAMAFAHARGVLHRDLKPANLMLGEFGTVMVMDWGLAKVTRANPGATQPDAPDFPAAVEGDSEVLTPVATRHSESSSDVTMDGALIGTPAFMAPEQAQGRVSQLDERTDIFALGAILYNVLTLHMPVPGGSIEEVLSNAQTAYIPPPVFYNKSAGFNDDGSVIDTPADLPHIPGGEVPESLSAVAMKALAPDPADRYQTVGELQADIAAYLGGFTTRAERPSLRRQLKLAIRRHKARFSVGAVAFVVFNAILLLLLWRLVESERHVTTALAKADAALTELRRSQPLLRTETLALIQQQQFEEALTKLGYLTLMSPKSAEYAAIRGNMLQSLQRFDEAKTAYAKALELDPTRSDARENLALSENLATLRGADGALPESAVKMFAQALTRQGRHAESVALLQESGGSNQQLFEQWKAALRKAGLTEAQLASLKVDADGKLAADFYRIGLTNLSPLGGMPFKKLVIADNPINDLSPLAGMPLDYLKMGNTAVIELSPLRGLPLTNLLIYNCKVTDLAPLNGMPLKSLSLNNSTITTFSALKGLPLEELFARALPVADLSPLQGMPLRQLDLNHTRVRELAPLKGAALESLDLESTQAADLAPLAGMPLKELSVRATPVSDLRPLQGMPLASLNVISTKVSDISPLKGMPLDHLGLSNTKVRDLRLLAEMPLTQVELGNLDLRSLAVLRGKPLRWLSLDGNKGLTDLSVLRGMPLQTLWLNGTGVKDFTPLLACAQLEQLLVPTGAPSIEVLRRHPNLKRISYKGSKDARGTWSDLPTPEEFWRDFDAAKNGDAK